MFDDRYDFWLLKKKQCKAACPLPCQDYHKTILDKRVTSFHRERQRPIKHSNLFKNNSERKSLKDTYACRKLKITKRQATVNIGKERDSEWEQKDPTDMF